MYICIWNTQHVHTHMHTHVHTCYYSLYSYWKSKNQVSLNLNVIFVLIKPALGHSKLYGSPSELQDLLCGVILSRGPSRVGSLDGAEHLSKDNAGTHTLENTHTYGHTHTCTHAHTHTHTHTYMHACTHAHTHTHTHTHTHAHTHTHTVVVCIVLGEEMIIVLPH